MIRVLYLSLGGYYLKDKSLSNRERLVPVFGEDRVLFGHYRSQGMFRLA